jgi:hypothetical protein
MKIKNTTYTIQNDNCRCEFDDRKDKTEWLKKIKNCKILKASGGRKCILKKK